MAEIIVEDQIIVNRIEVSDSASFAELEISDETSVPNRYGLSGRSPYIGENGNWYSFDDNSRGYYDTGIAATDEEIRSRVDNIEVTIDDILQKEIIKSFNSYLLFPNIGDRNILYIDTSTDKSYRWSSDDLKYYILGDESFEILNGGN